MMGFFQKIMRRRTVTLIRVIVNEKVLEKKSKKVVDVNDDLQEFFDQILNKLEEKLSRQKYLTGEKLTIIDIMFYCEIVTILKMYNKEVPRDQCACLHEWFETLSKNPALMEMDNHLASVL